MTISSAFDSGIRNRAFPPRGRDESGKRIFVVDDEAPIVAFMATVLKNAGYAVDSSTDSREALALISANLEAYDLLITDWNMPHISGKELIHELKASGFRGNVIMHSGSMQGDDETLKTVTGADAILHKPSPLTVIIAHVRTLKTQGRLH